jgi:hypothetical protein
MVISTADTADIDSVINDLGGEFAPAAGIAEDFVFDSSSTTEEDIKSDGFVDLEGTYHLEVYKVELNLSLLTEEGKEQTPHIKVMMKVLQSVPGQSPAGSMFSHLIYVGASGGGPAKKGSIDSMYRFGIGIGLLKWHNVNGKVVPVLAKDLSTKIPVSAWKDAVGCQTLAKVTKEKNNNQSQGTDENGQPTKTYRDRFVIQMGRCHRPDDPDYAHVPKNVEAMQAIGLKAPAKAATGAAAGATTAKAAQAYQKTAQATGGTTTAAAGATAATATANSPTSPAGKSEEGGLFDDF